MLGLFTGCRSSDDDGWHPDAQFAPSLRPAFGARVTGGELQLWTGSPCVGVTRLSVVFDLATSGSAETVWTVPRGATTSSRGANGSGVTVERFTLGMAPEGLTVSEPLSAGYDWRSAATAHLLVDGPPVTWGSSVELAEVTKNSAAHPDDTYYFQDVGWLDPAQVAAQDGKTFLTTCTPDPAKG